MNIRTQKLYELTERAFNEYKTEHEDYLGKKEIAGFTVDIGKTSYAVRITKGRFQSDEFLIVRIYSKNDKILEMFNIEKNYNSFEQKTKWFGVYLQCLYTFGLIKMF